MKKNVLILIVAALAAILSACNSDSTVTSMSLKPSSEMESSSSEEMFISSSSSVEEISSSSSSEYSYFYGEAGKVCDEWAVQVVTASQTYQAYMSMYQTCGDLKTAATGKGFGRTIHSWIFEVTDAYPDVGVAVSNEVNKYGSSLHFYPNDDGGLNYIYVEPVMDGAGMK